MSHIDSRNRPVVRTFHLGRHPATTELSFALEAVNEATLQYGAMRRISRDGRRVTRKETVFGLGNHLIELSSAGGPLELTIEAGPDRVVEFSTDDPEPAAWWWTFVADPNWSGGSVNEEASEIARMELEGQPLPSRPTGPGLPSRGDPAMPTEFTRPWAPGREAEGHGVVRPTRAARPVDDDPIP